MQIGILWSGVLIPATALTYRQGQKCAPGGSFVELFDSMIGLGFSLLSPAVAWNAAGSGAAALLLQLGKCLNSLFLDSNSAPHCSQRTVDLEGGAVAHLPAKRAPQSPQMGCGPDVQTPT